MGVDRPGGAAGGAAPSLVAAARHAAMACCPRPAAQGTVEDPALAQRPRVHGGGPAAHQAHGQRGDGRPGLGHPAHACRPGAAQLAGAAPAVALRGGQAERASFVLAAMLASSAPPPDPGPGALRQLGAQLVTILGGATGRLLSALAGQQPAAAPDSSPASAAPTSDRSIPAPALQPPPPAATQLEPSRARPADGTPGLVGDAGRGLAAHADGTPSDATAPTAWLPIAGGRVTGTLRGSLGGILEQVDALLEERGITRLQLVVLMLAAPLATAFAIEVVASILAGR